MATDQEFEKLEDIYFQGELGPIAPGKRTKEQKQAQAQLKQNREATRVRKNEARLKIVLGGMLIQEARNNPEAQKLIEHFNSQIKKDPKTSYLLK